MPFLVLLNSTSTAYSQKMATCYTAADGPYDVTMVSPRNYFLYTPLLPSAATGTVEPRSIVDPVRSHIPDTVGQSTSDLASRSLASVCTLHSAADLPDDRRMLVSSQSHALLRFEPVLYCC